MKCKDIYKCEMAGKERTVKEIETFTIEMFEEWLLALQNKHYIYWERHIQGAFLQWEYDDRDVCFVTCRCANQKTISRTIRKVFGS